MNKDFRGKMKFFVFAFCFLFVFLTDCLAKSSGVLFYAGFEDSIDAKAKGNGQGELGGGGGDPFFTEGNRGKAFISGDTEGYVNYEIEGNIPIEEGSVEMWVCPVDWNGKQNQFHIFFEASDPGWFILYKYNNTTGLFLTSETRENYSSACGDFSKIRPGKWYQLVATWGKKETCLYMNGKLLGKNNNPQIPHGLAGKFNLGDRAWSNERDNRSLIDEVYIYDRPLNKDEVKWTYDNALERKPGEGVPRELSAFLHVNVGVFSDKNEIQVNLKSDDSEYSKDFTGRAWLDPAAGTKESPVKFTAEGTGQASIKYKELPKGDYRLMVKVYDKDKAEVISETHTIKSPGPAVWLGNKIGISDTPPFPFTAIKTQGKDSFSCWGRTYIIGKLGFPVQITSAGKELLQSPVELKIISGETMISWEQVSFAKIEESKTRVQYKGSAKSLIGVLEWLCTAEYDGTVRYDIELKPSPNAVVNNMELVFRMKPEHSGLYHVIPNVSGRGGEIARSNRVFFKDRWKAYWWLGDEERGLCGFCESDQAWDKVDRPDGFYMRRNSESVDAVWSFVDSECKLDKPWKFTFGVQATPVKDITGWRKFRMSPGRDARIEITWPDPSVQRYYGYPEAANPERFKKTVEGRREKNIMVVPYSCLTYLSEGSPEWCFYKEQWKNTGIFYGNQPDDVGAFKQNFSEVLPTQTWIDFIVWANDRYVREYDLGGLYHDMTYVVASSNQLAGCGYVRGNEVRPTYPFFKMRELYKRIYTMLKEYGKEKGKDMFMMGHMSGQMVAPVLGFCDSYLDGELFADRVKNNYLEFLPLDYIRSEYMGHNYGVMPYFLPARPGVSKKVAKELTGLMLIHDFDIWPIWGITGEINRAYKALDEFGFTNAEFTGYWKNSDLVSVTEESEDAVECSFYRKPKAGTLICVANLVDEECTATLVVEWDKLKSQSPLSVIDAVSKEDINIQGKNLAVGIGPLGYRILWVK